MRFARGDLRTHIDSYKNDHRLSYWLQSTLPLQQCRKNDFREIFGVFRFSTFSTASTHRRHIKTPEKTCSVTRDRDKIIGYLCRGMLFEMDPPDDYG